MIHTTPTTPATKERQGGQALVEFAIAFPLQLLFTLGIMQFCLVQVGGMVTSYAAYAAARAALAADDDPAQAQLDAQEAAAAVLTPITGLSLREPPEAELDYPGWGRWSRAGVARRKTRVPTMVIGENSLRVEVEHDYELIIPLVNRIFAALDSAFFGRGHADPAGRREAEELEAHYGAVHLRLRRSMTMARPWGTE